jgi:hypothetical protein
MNGAPYSIKPGIMMRRTSQTILKPFVVDTSQNLQDSSLGCVPECDIKFKKGNIIQGFHAFGMKISPSK